ncbi:MAG: hypothetical protein RL367_2628, partial [Pseudomonadota bacterium]
MALVLLVMTSGTGQAQGTGAVQPLACVTRAQAADTPGALMADSGRFDCTSPQTGFGPGDYWVRMQGFSLTPPVGDQLVFRTVSMWQESAQVHFLYGDGQIARTDYSARHSGPFMTIGAVFEIPVPWRTVPVTGVLVRIHKSANVRGILLGPEVTTARASAVFKDKWIALYAGFAGLALTLMIYHFALWRALGHRFQLLYCGMVAAMGCYTFSASGVMSFVHPAMHNIARLQCGYGFLALSAIMVFLFAGSFFEPRVMTPRLTFWVRASAAILGVSTIAFIVLAQAHVMFFVKVYYLGYIPGVFTLVAMMIGAARRKSDYLGMFLLCWSPPLMAGMARWLHGINLLPYSWWLDNSSIIAFALEALISSTAISIRIRALSDDRDTARAQAHGDPLTGLLNRRGFLAQAMGGDGDQGLLLFDIDHFKRVNDTYGHDQGDEVLRQFALVLRKAAPPGAIRARIGGEEFVLLLSPGDGAPGVAAAVLGA